MKKVVFSLAVAVMSLLPFAFSGNAFAASCPIGFTGPNSANICTSTTTYACTVENDTTVDVTNQNTQVTVSGDATTGGNGMAGGTSTGSATNSNGTTFTATVTNNGVTPTCSVVASVPATPTPTPTTQGGGAGALRAPQAVTAKVLPNTSSNTTPFVLAGIGAFLGVAAIAARLIVTSYSHVKS